MDSTRTPAARLDGTDSQLTIEEETAVVIDLTDGIDNGTDGPTIDLRSTANDHTPSISEVDIDFLAQVLVESSIPIFVDDWGGSIELTVDDLTVTIDDPEPGLNSGPTWGDWAPVDRTEVGQIITPRIVSTARRLFKMMRAGRPFIGSQGTYYQTHQRFSVDYVRRNLSTLISDHVSQTDDSDTPSDSSALLYAAQYRLEYFIGLPDNEFDACFRFTGEITADYLLHADRSDRLYAERRQGAPATPAHERRKRKAKVLENH